MTATRRAAATAVESLRAPLEQAVDVIAREVADYLRPGLWDTAQGVSLVVAVLGTPTSYAAAHAVFQRAWWLLAGVAWLGALAAPRMTPAPKPVVTPAVDLIV